MGYSISVEIYQHPVMMGRLFYVGFWQTRTISESKETVTTYVAFLIQQVPAVPPPRAVVKADMNGCG